MVTSKGSELSMLSSDPGFDGSIHFCAKALRKGMNQPFIIQAMSLSQVEWNV